ncbi:mechanosensitive ion channel family protein [Agrobacterium tumefaciens]|uniref:mechanosensitive ion channel family protein n=1 Tax=Agrobacterium tumefaciens TaxID=358 RepID=UPI0012B91B58|nr:mechanosensitive ion channel family protein [Agrobacterium tumefaciens]MQB04763.1 mechanosensitive ion channel family protein [Agrobacterium tumefaciens]
MNWFSVLMVLLGAIPVLAQIPSPGTTEGDASTTSAYQQKIGGPGEHFEGINLRRQLVAQTDRNAEAAPPSLSRTHDETSTGDITRAVSAWETRARVELQRLVSSMPHIPEDIRLAYLRLRADATSESHATATIVLCLLVASAVAAEWLVRRKLWRHGKGAEHYLPTAVLATFTAAFFFAIEWPPLVRLVVACFLAAFITYRFIAAGIAHAAHPEIHGRLKIIVAWVVIAMAFLAASTVLEVDDGTLNAVALLASMLTLMLAIELVWRKLTMSIAVKTMLSLYLAGVWLLWCLDFKALFWAGIYIVVFPPTLRAIGHTLRDYIAAHFLIPQSDSRNVLIVRGARATIIGLAVAWIATVWETDGHMGSQGDPRVGAVFYGFLKSIVVLLLADLVWHLAKAAIDRNVPSPGSSSTVIDMETNGAVQESPATRLHTLLPILRNAVAVALFVTAGLVILGQLGVDIGPLVAGAGIFGVAIGFGSQALVRDVISGIFYLFDDAFRVGEYIQAKNYKGTVEGFSLRSVKLRHHRGPLFTIPFGELGAVENMSRDWSKVKFVVTVPYDTDIEKARKIGKAIGRELLSDPELGPLFIEPLKMKGVEEFGAYGIVISFAMITLPTSQQSFIRRSAYAMLREAFQRNGIEFAQPSVQIGSAKTQEAHATAYQAHELTKADEREPAAEL